LILKYQIEIEYLKATFETKIKAKSVLLDKKLANLERELDEAKLKIIETESKWESSCESNRQLEQKILDLKSEIKQTAEKYKQRINELKHSLEVKIADYTRQLKEKTTNIVKDNQEKVLTISTVNEIINTLIPNEPSKRITRSTAKEITILESLNQQPKKL